MKDIPRRMPGRPIGHAAMRAGNRTMVRELIACGALRTGPIIGAFEHIDRADFVLPEYRSLAYHDGALPIGFSQTISQPRVVAFMLELLRPRPGEKILDVGSGSGWTTALLAAIAGKNGTVCGAEIVPELTVLGRNNLEKYDLPQAEIVQAGAPLGLPDRAPFDRILVSAAGPSLPEELVDQLAVGGTMVIPIGEAVWRVNKISPSDIKIRRFDGFVFVPLRRDRGEK